MDVELSTRFIELRKRIWQNSRFTPFPRITILEIIITLIVTYLFVQTALLLILRWSSYDINSRPELFANLSYNLLILLVTLEVFYVNGRLRICMKMIAADFEVTSLDQKLYEEKKLKIVEMEDISIRNSRKLIKILLFFSIEYSFSCFYGILMCIYKPRPFDDLPLTFSVFLPESLTKSKESSYLYIFVALLQCWYLHFGQKIISILYSSRLFSYNSLFTEIELFIISLKELDRFRFENETPTENGHDNRFFSCKETVTKNDVERLRKIVRILGIQHQIIFKKISMFEEGGRYHFVYINSCICALLCLAIFCTQRVTSYHLKVKYGLFALSMLLCCMMYSENGQRLIDRGERTRKALYECSWMDKPVWVQKAILFMMMRNTKDYEINFYGVFSTNRKNVSSLLQAAYSYLSFLKNTS